MLTAAAAAEFISQEVDRCRCKLTDNITNEQSMHRYKDYCKQQLVGCSLDELAKYLTVGRRNEIPLERNSKKKNLGCCRKHLGPM